MSDEEMLKKLNLFSLEEKDYGGKRMSFSVCKQLL